MNRDTITLPSARTWRDIPQPVVPRAMSREGRWRFVMAGLRVATLGAVFAVCAWGVWLVAVSVRENAQAMPAVAKATPMKPAELRTDGVLDNAWLGRTLGIPRHASLMELDIEGLRARVLADDQVVTATITRSFPDRLIVQISERSPVARVMTEWLGQKRALLVARDGVIYGGTGYDAGVLETLPWLDGIAITPAGGGFRPIEGMASAAELLAKARLEAEHLYHGWNVISLAKLASDERIEVRTKDESYVAYFSTRDDFFRQLVKLNYICDQLANATLGARATIDLTLGADVPVTLVEMPAEPMPAAGSKTPAVERSDLTAIGPRFGSVAEPARSEPALFVLSHSQPRKTKREL